MTTQPQPPAESRHAYVLRIVCKDLRAHEEITETCMRFHCAVPNSVYIASEEREAPTEAHNLHWAVDDAEGDLARIDVLTTPKE